MLLNASACAGTSITLWVMLARRIAKGEPLPPLRDKKGAKHFARHAKYRQSDDVFRAARSARDAYESERCGQARTRGTAYLAGASR
jgi:hypothetical protein